MDHHEKIPIELLSYPDWHDKPFRLNKYELKNPMKVLDHYRSHYSLPEIREAFRDLIMDAAALGNPSGSDNLGFQEETEKFIESVFWMCDEGMVVIDPDRRTRQNTFLGQFFKELDNELLDLRMLLDKVLTYRDPEKEVFGPQTLHAIQKAKVLGWKIESAHDSLEIMTGQFENKEWDFSLVPATVQTASFINSCARTFDDFKPAFNKGLAVIIEPKIQSTFITDKVKLKTVIKNLLHIGFDLCPANGDVLLSCTSSGDELTMAISFEDPLCAASGKEPFAAYACFANSAVAGTHLYCSKVLTEALKGKLYYFSDQRKTYFKIMFPLMGVLE